MASMTVEAGDPSRRIVAHSAAMQDLLANVSRFAVSNSPVLISGESGTGKELIARLLHRLGPRSRSPFVPVNCGAIPETLIESELFGHRKGAFTGAINERVGLLEGAHGGVIFLDEIGEMAPSMQVRLLRFLENGEIRPIGASSIRHVNARVVAATHRALDEEIGHGRFREDLFYRIGVLRLHVPPLRGRAEDIHELAHAHLRRVTATAKLAVGDFAPGVIERLAAYRWPGNVRELQGVVERAAHHARGPLITEQDLPDTVTRESAAAPAAADRPVETSEDSDRAHLRDVMNRWRWNRPRAAKALGISRTTLWRRLRDLKLDSEPNGEP